MCRGVWRRTVSGIVGRLPRRGNPPQNRSSQCTHAARSSHHQQQQQRGPPRPLIFFLVHSYLARANSIRAHARFVRGPGPPTKSQSSIESSLPLTPVYGLPLPHLCPPLPTEPTYLPMSTTPSHSPFKPDAWRTKILAVQSPVPCHLWPLIVCRSVVHTDRHRLTAWIGRARTRWRGLALYFRTLPSSALSSTLP